VSASEPTEILAGPRDTFVVRLWADAGSDSVRGHIQHLGTRQRADFSTPQRLLAFIQEHTRMDVEDQCRS